MMSPVLIVPLRNPPSKLLFTRVMTMSTPRSCTLAEPYNWQNDYPTHGHIHSSCCQALQTGLGLAPPTDISTAVTASWAGTQTYLPVCLEQSQPGLPASQARAPHSQVHRAVAVTPEEEGACCQHRYQPLEYLVLVSRRNYASGTHRASLT